MNGRFPGVPPQMIPTMGCLTVAFVVLFLCMLPVVFFDVMVLALEKLHLSQGWALVAVMGIFMGSLVNVPVHRIEREEEQVVEMAAIFGFWGRLPVLRRVSRDTVICVNIGGCVIPTALALWELLFVAQTGGLLLLALVVVVTANIFVCYKSARPIRGVGIAMPGFVSPLVSVGLTLLLLATTGYEPEVRAPVAFVAGVLGPLVGADLMHLKDITRVSAGMLSIGGAGTFDGIVLSGMLAALLA